MAGTTIAVSLSQFLKTLFPKPQGIVTLVRAEPGRNGEVWFNDINASAVDDGRPLGRLYVCVSTCDPVGRRSRRPSRKHPVLSYLIVLDDIGTKVPIEKLPPGARPTYAMESSPGNFQLGFRLTAPVDPRRAAALFDALATAGLTDPGAKSNVRLVRVPGSLNGKPKLEEFASRLTTWNPELSYTFSELCIALGVAPRDVSARGTVPALEPGQTDHVAEWAVRHQGEPGGATGAPIRGLIPVLCPRHDQHTVGIDRTNDSSTVWIPGSPGAFKCTHGHCAAFTTREYLAWCRETYPDDPPPEHGAPTSDISALGVKLREALQNVSRETGTDGSMFGAPPYEVARALADEMSLVEALTSHVAALDLGPHVLPNAERLAAGNGYKVSQTVTQARVHLVMDTIGLHARFNAMTRTAEFNFPHLDWYDPKEDKIEAAQGAFVHAASLCHMRGEDVLRGYLGQRALEAPWHPTRDWILATKWDGVDRLPEFYETIEMREASQNGWRNAALGKWLLQACAAIDNYDQGRDALAVGYTLVLQGPQLRGKSEWIKSLLPHEWVTIGVSLRLDSNERDAVIRATQTPIAELGELDAIFKKADIAALKNFLTTPVDVYRMPFGRGPITMPRCTTFIATVNPEEFLVDSTGDRRFWPLAIEQCHDKHTVDMRQVWAQAWKLYAAGETWELTADERAMHARAADQHRSMSRIAEHVGRVQQFAVAYPVELDKTKWIRAQAGEILEWMTILRPTARDYGELTAELTRAGFERKVVRGVRAWHIPDIHRLRLTPAQETGLQVASEGETLFDKREEGARGAR